MISILYQNNVTGDAFDVTTLCAGAKWSTKRSGSPASLELTVIVDDSVTWTHGGIVALKDGKTGIFYGYVVKIRQKETDRVEVTAYDQTWYLKKNKETYVFTGKRADQILTQIAADFGLKCGALENTGYAIPSMIEDGQTLFDIVLKALDHTLINSGKMFVLWDDFGSLRITDEDMNEAQIKERGGQMLELYNRPKKSFEVKALLDLSVRAGRALYIGIKDVGVSSFFVVEEASADLLKEQMTLKLKVV